MCFGIVRGRGYGQGWRGERCRPRQLLIEWQSGLGDEGGEGVNVGVADGVCVAVAVSVGVWVGEDVVVGVRGMGWPLRYRSSTWWFGKHGVASKQEQDSKEN